MYKLLTAIFTTLYTVASYTPDAINDQIHNLPGLNYPINFNQFSGYLNITNTKHIHYWFVESQNIPQDDPIVFWTNGGPGCSGLLGFFDEHGPFRPDENLNLELNEWSWNKISNMVYLEQPIGTGFSYSDNKEEYKIDDEQCAIDNKLTIVKFLERFPEYKKNDLYLTSESYGGHYIPELAWEIINDNSDINLKGFAIGNPFTDYASGVYAQLEAYWGRQLIPKPLWDDFNNNDCFANINNTLCSVLMVKMLNGAGNINPYALDYPVCTSPQQNKLSSFLFEDNDSLYPFNSDYQPCEEDYTTTYLNNKSVKKAINVNDIDWEVCSSIVKYNLLDKMKRMEKFYPKILNNSNLRILIYSGDDDGVCATIGTQKWIYNFGFDIKELWRQYYVDGNLGGYLTTFTPNDNTEFIFATVHFAGHEVPAYKPKQAYLLYQSFLNDDFVSL